MYQIKTKCGYKGMLPETISYFVYVIGSLRSGPEIIKLADIMKNETLKEILRNYPNQIIFDSIIDFENFDERLSVIDCIAVNMIGVQDGFIEFIPDNTPPLEDEILCWIWAFRPDLTNVIYTQTKNKDLKFALNSYLNNSMDNFWNYIS